MTNNELEAVSARLITLAAALQNAHRPIDKRVAKAALETACDIVSVLGYGRTYSAVYMAVWDWSQANPQPAGTALNVERKAWRQRGIADVSDALSALA